MAAPIIFSGNSAKLLKQNLDFFGQFSVLSGTVDPTSVAVSAPASSLYHNTSTAKLYRKLDSGSSTNWKLLADASNNDISETSFSAANNQAVAANVTGLNFANASVRSFEVLLSVYVDATTDLFQSFKLHGIQKGASWEMNQTSIGDNSGFTFTITNAGQIQYTSGNYAGFASATIKFRALTLGI